MGVAKMVEKTRGCGWQLWRALSIVVIQVYLYIIYINVFFRFEKCEL